jgi:tRNA(Ile)-lysidine synthase
VALLRLLSRVAPRLNLDLRLAHFDHALRAESGSDAQFVSELARSFAIPIHLARWDAPRPGEAAAREARFGFLDAVAHEQRCDAVVVGHHLDDRIETMLLHLARGTGLRGTYGMRWRSRWGRSIFVRPLLDVTRDTLRGWLTEQGAMWREDATNVARGARRNRLRLDGLPALDATLEPGWRERWGGTLDDLLAASDLVESQARGVLRRAVRGAPAASLDLVTLRRAPELVLRAALRTWFETELWRDRAGATRALQIRRGHLEAAARMIESRRTGGRLVIPGGRTLHVDRRHATLTREGEPDVATSDLELVVRELGGRVDLATWNQTPTREVRVKVAAEMVAAPARSTTILAADELVGGLSLGTAAPGDRVRLLGAPGSRRLCRILQDRAVPRRHRADWPVVRDLRGIVWVPGIGIAERVRIGPNSARVLELRVFPGPGAAPPVWLAQGQTAP